MYTSVLASVYHSMSSVLIFAATFACSLLVWHHTWLLPHELAPDADPVKEIHWQGFFDPTILYQRDDLVFFDNSAFLCTDLPCADNWDALTLYDAEHPVQLPTVTEKLNHQKRITPPPGTPWKKSRDTDEKVPPPPLNHHLSDY